MLPNGEIEFVGRKDGQIKLNGQRIELSEIEQQLLKIETIKEAAVLQKEYDQASYLVAYIRKNKDIEAKEIKHILSFSLPQNMVPKIYLSVEEFPLTPTGKINRNALPDLCELDLPKVEYVAPRNEIEEKLVKIWEEVLGKKKEEIGVHDDFFDLGGDSLKAFRVVSRIQNVFGLSLELRNFFSYPNIEDISEYISISIWIEDDKGESEENQGSIII